MTIAHYFIAFVAILLLVPALRKWLVAAWIFSILVLPLIRFELGAPVYVMDVLGVLLLGQMFGRGGRPLRFMIFPWPWMFVSLALISTLAAGLLLFDYHLEQIWIWGHYSISCLPLVFASILRTDQTAYYTRPLLLGLTASLLILSGIGLVQYFELPGNPEIREMFYGHFKSDSRDVGEWVEQMWHNKTTDVTRVPGPHFSPGAFGGTTLLALLALVVLQRGKYTVFTYLSMVSTAIVALTSVTRLVVVASVMGAIVFIFLSSHKVRLKSVFILGAAGLVGVTLFGSYFGDAWSERMGRWNKGVMEDDNVLARAVDGPLRLVDFFNDEPLALVFGAGPDPEKLLGRTQQDSSFRSGFVSNSFLLSLYYMGGVGFLFYTGFWWCVLRSSFKAPMRMRSVFASSAVICGILIAADNYAMMFEAAAAVLNLIAGLILTEIIVIRRESRLKKDSDPCEALEELHAA